MEPPGRGGQRRCLLAGLSGPHSGLDRDSIARVRSGPDAPGWTPRQALLLRAGDELHDARRITEETWAPLAALLSDQQLIELCLLVGHYEMLAMTLNSLGVQPEPSAVRALGGRAAEVAESLRAGLGSTRRRASPPSA